MFSTSGVLRLDQGAVRGRTDSFADSERKGLKNFMRDPRLNLLVLKY